MLPGVELVSDLVHTGARRFADRPALRDPAEAVTYAELAANAGRIAAGLVELGLEPGERAVVVLPNSVNFVRAHFAVLTAGGVSVPCDAQVSEAAFGAITASARPRVLLTDQVSYGRLAPAIAESGIEQVVIFAGEAPKNKTSAQGEATTTTPRGVRLVSAAEFADRPAPAIRRSPEDLAALMYTTGTTGRPKGVMLTHRNVLTALRNICEFVGYTPEDREVVILPLSHNFGLGHVYCNLLSGGAVYTENGLARVGRVLKTIDEWGATGFPGTPMGYGMLIDKFAPVLAERCRRLRFAVINSAPLPPERTAQLRDLLPETDIMVYYGLTEASRSTFISLSRSGPAYDRSVGKPMRDVQLRLRPLDGEQAEPGSGEVLIHGPTVTAGYWQDEAATQAVLKEGWLHTGDIGRLDADGNLFITGRLKDFVNVGGYKVNPSEVEETIRAFAGIEEAAVAGVEGLDGLTGEAVVAGIIPQAGSEPDLAALERHCLGRLEKFKVPARFVVIDAIPRSDTGKVKRQELAGLLAKRLRAEAARA